MVINKSNIPDKNLPKYILYFEVDDVTIELEDGQYKSLLEFFDRVFAYQHLIQFYAVKFKRRKKGKRREKEMK